jgi:hypothetical protein
MKNPNTNNPTSRIFPPVLEILFISNLTALIPIHKILSGMDNKEHADMVCFEGVIQGYWAAI